MDTEGPPRLLADATNRAVLAAVEAAEGPIHVEELADRLVADEVSLVRESEFEDRIEAATVSLHHHRLPELADAGVVEYDADANVVERAPTTPTVEWLDDPTTDAQFGSLSVDGPDGNGVGVIEGREAAIRYGRGLADAAERELFCMYVDTALLEDECLRRARRAIDRGVSMALGSGNPEVRDLARRHLPEVTVWEPQLDWLNTPTYPRVGRLVLADRERAMLAVLEEPPTEDGSPGETAIVGDGADSPPVTLVRELLGPRLDHLDYQSEDFASELES